MAGDWIKFEKETLRKPEVFRIANKLHVPRHQAVGMLLEFWAWCDSNSLDGHAPFVTASDVDAIVGVAGFSSALLEVAWLSVRSGSLIVPHFDRHLSQSAKNRGLAGERQRKRRHESVTNPLRAQRDNSVTREEKRRETKRKEKHAGERIRDGTAVNDPESPDSSSHGQPFGNSEPFPDPVDDLRIPDDPHTDWLTAEATFLSMWNASAGTCHLTGSALPFELQSKFRQRWSDPAWRESVPKAFAKLAVHRWWTGKRVTLTQFLLPTAVGDFLQHVEDEERGNNRSHNGRHGRRGSGSAGPPSHLTLGGRPDEPILGSVDGTPHPF